MEEKEFSFKNYFIYIIRKWIALVVCVVVGAAVGAYYSLSYKTTDIAVYEGNIRFSIYDYYAALNGNTDKLGEGEFALLSATADDVIAVATDPLLKTATYEAMKDSLNFKTKTDNEKRDKFFAAFKVVKEDRTVRVDFAYDIDNEDDEKTAKEVVSTYLTLAKDNAKEKIVANNPELAEDNKVLTVSDVRQNFDTAEMKDLVATNEKPSIVNCLLIGILGGLVLGVVIDTAIYLFDPRVKSVYYALPAGKDNVISAEKELIGEGSFVALRTAIDNSGADKLLISSPAPDGNVVEYAKAFADYLTQSGKKAELTVLSAEDKSAEGDAIADWRRFFNEEKTVGADELKIFVYDNTDKSALGYIGSKIGASCIVLNQATQKCSAFITAVEEVSAGDGKYLGTVVYNTTDSWLD